MAASVSHFRGILSIDESQVASFTKFLQGKENELVVRLIRIFALEETDSPPTKLVQLTNRLVNEQQKYLSSLSEERLAAVTVKFRSCVWDYLMVIETEIAELFKELNQILIDAWDPALLSALGKLTAIMTERLEELEEELERFDTLFERHGKRGKKSRLQIYLSAMWPFKSPAPCADISSNIKQCRTQLASQYSHFIQRYTQNKTLNEQAKYASQRFSVYSILQSLSPSLQESFFFTYRLLKIWEMDAKTKGLLTQDLKRFAESKLEGDKSQKFFFAYFKQLESQLYSISRNLKEDLTNSESRQRVRDIALKSTKGYKKELKTLERLVARYREFLLRTDPNPYVRARMGFAEWVSGPEPSASKQLLQLEEEIADLDALYQILQRSLEAHSSKYEDEDSDPTCLAIQQVLHTMALPVSSRRCMHHHSGQLTELLKEFNELGSDKSWAVKTVQDSLERALRADWDLLTLFEHREFHQLYKVHLMLLTEIDPIQERTFEGIKEGIQKILHIHNQGEVQRRNGEIGIVVAKLVEALDLLLKEVDKLDDFQGDESEKESAVWVLRRLQLNYRYLLGGFFHTITFPQSESFLRRSFASAERLIESIDNTLNL